jgi:predicted dehydrogenase
MNNDQPMSRRGFLTSTAAAAGALAATGIVSAAEKSTPVEKPTPTDKPGQAKKQKRHQRTFPAATQTKYSQIRVACIGVGGRGWSDFEEVAKCGANIVALCDIDSERLERASAERPDAKTYADFRKLFDKQGKEIDAVVVATPDNTHAVAAMQAMKMGKHVYCEKPLTYDIYEARMLTEAAAKHGVKTQMGNQGAAEEAERRQIEYVRSKIVGDIKEVHVYTNRPIWPQGLSRPTRVGPVPSNINYDLWLGPAQERPYYVNDKGDSVYLPFKWRGWWDFGTGALGDMACHLMNTAYWALNLTNPSHVEAISDGKTDVQAPNWQVIKWQFPELNGRPPVTMFWYDGKMFPPTSLMDGKPFPGDGGNGTVFVGEKGNIGAGYIQMPFLVNDEQQKDIKPPEKFMPRSIGHHKEWLESILGGPTPASSFDYSGPLTEMVLLGNLATRTGKRLTWDQKHMKVNDSEAQKYVRREYRKGWTL